MAADFLQLDIMRLLVIVCLLMAVLFDEYRKAMALQDGFDLLDKVDELEV